MIARLSMRISVALAIFAMGLLAMALAFFSSEVYRHLTLDTQRATLVDYLRAETAKLSEEFELRTHALAQQAQNDAAFIKAATVRQATPLTRQLDSLYQHAANASGEIRLARLYLLDDKFTVLATSSLGDVEAATAPCEVLLAQLASARERARAAHRLCFAGERLYAITLVPLQIPGGAYLYAVGDVVPGISGLEHDLGAPLRLRRAGAASIYQSPNWPGPEALAQRAVGDLSLVAFAPAPTPLQLEIAKDMTVFFDRLATLRYLVLLGVAIATIAAMAVALFALEHTMLKPLRVLTVQLQRIRQDKRHLGDPVAVSGNTEVAELADGFNAMTGRLRELYESLERMAFTDALTGLPNRSLFHDRLQQAIFNAKREGKSFALLIMDLDRFKDINDTLGHHIGDQLLVQVAQRLRGKLRASDTVARMGGDEFAVLLPAVDAKHAGLASRMLLQALRAPFAVDDHNLHIGSSIGIALYPENGVDANILMQRADVAMYAAKAGTNSYAFYNSALDPNYPTRLTLLSDLRAAVEQEQFELYYQPIVNLSDNKVCGVEALARWRHPRNGVVLPESFIPLLEQSGMIHNLLPWVMSEALKQARSFELAGSALTVSINLSMRDLQDTYLVESFAEQLEAHQVTAGSLVLEITESAVMTDAPRTLDLLLKLSGMGLKFAVDDFGTGYSSLTYLKKLPVTTLKIDKSFVIGMTADENDAAIVRTSIDLAHNLGLKVVAEGVECEAAYRQLRALGCDMAQGLYVGRPLSRLELGSWLEQSSWGLRGVVTTLADHKRANS